MISVVVPVYNSARYLERCLDSLKAQSYGDWEAVCVDDGSTDGSAAILDRMAKDDDRIKVIHTENGGVSRARNIGVKESRGSYITFLDSDDYLHPQTLEICHRLAEETGADMVAYTYNRKYRTANLIREMLRLPGEWAKKPATYDPTKLEYLVTDDIYEYVTEKSHPAVDGKRKRWMVKHCQPWRALYRREAVENVEFIPGIIYEDFPWWGEVLLNVKRTAILNLPLYHYRPNRLSYILSSKEEFKIASLEKALRRAEEVYADAPERKRKVWEEEFIAPFRAKLEKKKR
ncbi:MAG: glycosyltransferase family 2 protein [Muribaculaceae bacterium]|nr:glycosyltransferase family 2 protein [Muribaculaceae bacterium]